MTGTRSSAQSRRNPMPVPNHDRHFYSQLRAFGRLRFERAIDLVRIWSFVLLLWGSLSIGAALGGGRRSARGRMTFDALVSGDTPCRASVDGWSMAAEAAPIARAQPVPHASRIGERSTNRESELRSSSGAR